MARVGTICNSFEFSRCLQRQSELYRGGNSQLKSQTFHHLFTNFPGVMVFEALFPQFDFSDERIQTLVGIFETNAIEIRLATSEVQALYETGCLLEHSCLPNLRMTFDDKFNVS